MTEFHAVPRPRPAYPIASVDRALRLLLLVAQRSRMRLTEASEALGVAPSTAHRLLAMLVFHDLVRQEDRHAYVPGPALTAIARATISEMDLRLLAGPIIGQLAAATGETAHLAVLEGRMVRYLEGVESTRALRMVARTGRTVPAHYVSTGKALLAAMPWSQVERMLAGVRLEAVTDRSVTDPGILVRQLQRVRRQGYAVFRGESEEGAASLAMTARDVAGRVVAAISVAAPAVRMDRHRQDSMLSELRIAVARLEEALRVRAAALEGGASTAG
jgi:IclR family acetate operon transcriptional repressor